MCQLNLLIIIMMISSIGVRQYAVRHAAYPLDLFFSACFPSHLNSVHNGTRDHSCKNMSRANLNSFYRIKIYWRVTFNSAILCILQYFFKNLIA